MDKVLLLITAASGLCVLSSHVRQFHFVYKLKNMTEAQSYCREKYTDLATIDNMEDVEMLTNMVDLSRIAYPLYPVWIGLYDARDSWRWSLSNTSFYTHGETEFRRWQSGQPNGVGSKEHCALMGNDGLWGDYNCENSHKAFCMEIRGSNVIFVLTNKPMTWTEAQSYCRKHHTDLASVRNAAENQKVNQLLAGGQRAWIGLFRDAWKWSDGSNSSFKYWSSGEPDNYGGKEACSVAIFSNKGMWGDWRCHKRRAFICYSRTTKKVFKVRLQKDSSLDLNDPAVPEQMLKQLKQKLKDQGVNREVKLSWRTQPDGKVFHED